MSLVGYIWNKWGSVPASAGKPTRASFGFLGDSCLGVFFLSFVDWCRGTLPLHTSAQQYKCAALILHLVTDQLLICINLSSLEAKKSSFRLTFFSCWLVWRGWGSWTLWVGYSSYNLLYKQAIPTLLLFCKMILSGSYCLLLTPSAENLKMGALPWIDVFNPWSLPRQSGRRRASSYFPVLSGLSHPGLFAIIISEWIQNTKAVSW